MTKKEKETLRLIATATDGSERTLERWRVSPPQGSASKLAYAAMQSLDKGGEPVMVGELEVQCRHITAAHNP